jgi:flagellar hook-associated protein 2
MGSFGIGGVGLDVNLIVQQIMFVERGPIRLLERQDARFNAQAAAFRDISDKLLTLVDAINALKDFTGTFNSKLATSSDTSILTAFADASAQVGTHLINVSQLATNSIAISNNIVGGSSSSIFSTGLVDGTALLGGRTLTVSDGTNPDISFTTVLNQFTLADSSGGSLNVFTKNFTTGKLELSTAGGGSFVVDFDGADPSQTLDELRISIDALAEFNATIVGTDLVVEAADGTQLTVVTNTIQTSGTAITLIDSETRALSTLSDIQAAFDADANFTSSIDGNGNLQVSSAGSEILSVTGNTITDAATSTQTLDFDALGTGKFTIQVGTGTAVEITVDLSNNTLAGIAQAINDLDLGVTATVITDVNGSRLAISSDTSGEAGDLTITQDGVDPVEGLSFATTAGQNALFTVDGVSVETSSNTVTDVIAGVTLNLLNVTGGTDVTLTIEQDEEKAREAVDEFVTAYNAVIQAINTQFIFNPVTEEGGVLSGDSTLRSVQSKILKDAVFAISGNNGIVNLATIGIDIADDGTLSVNSTELDNALASNFDDVQTFVTSFADNFSTNLDDLTDSIDGPLNIALKGITRNQSDIADTIRSFEVRLELRQQSLIEKFSRIDTLLRQLPALLAQVNNQLGILR